MLVFKRVLHMLDSTLALIGLSAAILEQLFLGFTGFFKDGKTTVSMQESRMCRSN